MIDVENVRAEESICSLLRAIHSLREGAKLDDDDDAIGMSLLQGAQIETREGRLFVVPHMTVSFVEARWEDSLRAIDAGELRQPFPFTAVLMEVPVEGSACATVFLSQGGEPPSMVSLIPDEADVFWFACDFMHVIETTKNNAAAVAMMKMSTVALGLIFDARSNVRRVVADEKRGVPPYWEVSPGATLLHSPGALLAHLTRPREFYGVRH
jgi:hypothetical protein